ncbi:MAG: hypothetical protein JJE52_03605 [Acidimicrobiia bacterium]|nr:hypothetical protein [Acidimicrobiia bacterium]
MALPSDAAFCPRCGAAAGSVPVLPLLPERTSRADDDPVEPTARPTRTIAVVVIAVVAVLVLLSALAGGDDGNADDPNEAVPTSTTRRRPTTTTRTPLSTTVATVPPPILRDGEVLDPAYGAALVVSMGDITTVVDLATGAELQIPNPTMLGPIVWTGETLLANLPNSGILRPADGAAEWEPVGPDGGSEGWVGPGGIIYLRNSTGMQTSYGGLTDSGEVMMWNVDLGAGAGAGAGGTGGGIGEVGDELVLNTFDGVFAVSRSGSARRVAHGRALAVSGQHLLRFACDESMQCRPSVIDLSSGAERHLPLLSDSEAALGSLSPGGTGVMVVGQGPDGEQRGLVLAGGMWVDIGPIAMWTSLSVAWAPDSSGLVWWDWNNGRVHSMGLGDPAGAMQSVQVSNEVRRRMPSTGDAPVVVVPLSGLPEAWRPALPARG